MRCQYIAEPLHLEQVALGDVAAAHGTPSYVYSTDQISENYRAYDNAFGARHHSICYAVKANSNIAILNLLRQLGATRREDRQLPYGEVGPLPESPLHAARFVSLIPF